MTGTAATPVDEPAREAKPVVPKARVRPTAIVRAAIREAANMGMDVEIRADGTVLLRRPSPLSTAQPVAKPKGVVL